MNKCTVIRIEHFNAAHRLFCKEWSPEKNQQVFGLCSNPNYHGHNYKLTVKVTGTVNAQTGFVVDLGWLSKIINTTIIERFDHKNLNLDTTDFNNLNPTAENIAIRIYELLKPLIDPQHDLQIVLAETENNIVQFPA